MKKILFANCILCVVVGMIGCKKGGGANIPPQQPTLTLTATPDTVWYSGTTAISWSTTNATAVSIVGSSTSLALAGSFTTPSLTNHANYTFSATGNGGTVTKSISVYVHSERTSFLSNFGPWKMTLNKARNVDSTSWVTFPNDCDTYQFYANNKGTITFGPCSPWPGSQSTFSWTLQNNEQQIVWPEVWNIDTLNNRKFQRSRTIADLFNLNIHYFDLQVFEHP